jgi:hypothetical protein
MWTLKAGKNYSLRVESEHKATWHTKCTLPVALRGLCLFPTTKWTASLKCSLLYNRITHHYAFSNLQWCFLKEIGKAVNEPKQTTQACYQLSKFQPIYMFNNHKEPINKWALFNRTIEQIRLFRNINKQRDLTATIKTRLAALGNR